MESPRGDGQDRSGWWFAAHVAAFLLMLLLVLLRYAPPRALEPGASGDEFSAGRVSTLLQKIIRPGVPHPTGGRDHARVRDAVVAEFRALGLEPEVQATFAREDAEIAEQVQNIVVHLRGTEGDDAIALAAHYDSVPAGPGVADDASGVCSILEIARIFTQGPPPRNDVIFLITDAEEIGLCGARAFAAEHPLMSKIRVVLNWEARGTRGPSFMFETGPGNLGLIRLMTRHCRRSISTSLFPAIYEVLPNDTDLTVFKERGVAGMNFAFIGGVPHYHTPCDNLENLDLGSVQHQGEHFLAMAQALSHISLNRLPKGDAVFFDMLGWFTVSWPQRWNLGVAIGVAVLALAVLLLTLRESEGSVRSFVFALFAWPIALIVAGLLGAGACWLVITCTGAPVPWWSWALPIGVTTWSIGIGTPALVWALLRKRISGTVASAVILVYWAVLGIVTACYMPGASYLFIVPAAIACLCRLVAIWRRLPWESANLVFLLAACALWLPLARGLTDALGFNPSFVHTIPLALIGLLIVPTITPDTRIFRFLLLVFSLMVIGLVTAMVVPTYSEQWPQFVSVTCIQNDEETTLAAHANLGQLPESMRHAIERPAETDLPHYMGWQIERDLVPPTIEVVAEEVVEEGRRLKLRLRPGENQHRVIIAADPDFGTGITIGGQAVEAPLKAVALNFSEVAETEIGLTIPGKIKLRVTGMQYGLPTSAEPLRKARPAWAAPVGRGDYTQVGTELEL